MEVTAQTDQNDRVAQTVTLGSGSSQDWAIVQSLVYCYCISSPGCTGVTCSSPQEGMSKTA